MKASTRSIDPMDTDVARQFLHDEGLLVPIRLDS